MKILLKLAAIIFIITLAACTNLKLKPLIDIPSVPPKAKEIGNVNVALALGGGGSRAIAHVGALEVLYKHHIPIDLIIGTSAGSAVGAMYADNPDPIAIKNKLMKLNKWDILDFSFFDSISILTSLRGPVRGKLYQKFLYHNIATKSIEQLKIPLIITTVDIEKNELFLIRSGPIAPAIHASSAIPPIFSPVKLYGRTLVDGGVIEPVPVRVAKSYNPKMVISVDIGTKAPDGPPSNMLDVTYRSIWIYYYELSRMQAEEADIDIHPNLHQHGTFEDDKKELLYNEGKKAAELAIPAIKKRLKELNIPLTEG